jgi:hypothetical protein
MLRTFFAIGVAEDLIASIPQLIAGAGWGLRYSLHVARVDVRNWPILLKKSALAPIED